MEHLCGEAIPPLTQFVSKERRDLEEQERKKGFLHDHADQQQGPEQDICDLISYLGDCAASPDVFFLTVILGLQQTDP